MKVLWLKDSITGHLNKARGLLRALGKRVEVELVECELDWRWSGVRQLLSRLGSVGLRLPIKWFVRQLPDLQGVDLILSAGGATQWPNAVMARQYGKKNVFLGSPRKMKASNFTLIALHDPPINRAPFYRFEIIPSMVTPGDAKQAADQAGLGRTVAWGLLIGGDGEGVVWLDKDYFALVGKFIEQAKAAGVGVWIATSRRTPKEIESQLRTMAGNSGILVGGCWYHSSPSRSVPLIAMMGACARLCVTIDSMSMTHEAVSSGRPVISIFPRRGGNPRLLANLESLEAAGFVVKQGMTGISIANATPAGGWKQVSDDPSAPLANAVLEALSTRDRQPGTKYLSLEIS
jgi:mitochondrial fission protein ELM1